MVLGLWPSPIIFTMIGKQALGLLPQQIHTWIMDAHISDRSCCTGVLSMRMWMMSMMMPVTTQEHCHSVKKR